MATFAYKEPAALEFAPKGRQCFGFFKKVLVFLLISSNDRSICRTHLEIGKYLKIQLVKHIYIGKNMK